MYLDTDTVVAAKIYCNYTIFGRSETFQGLGSA